MKKGILLIHGFLSEMDDFDSIHLELSKRYDIISFPVAPGHGYLDECNYDNFNKDDTLKYILDTFDELDSKCDLVDVLGFSMGGALATYLSQKRSFNKLILVAPANKYFNPKSIINSSEYAMKLFLSLEKAILMKDEKEQESYRELIAFWKGDNSLSRGFVVRKFLKSYIWHAYKEFKGIVKECNDSLLEIKNPVLILWGELDQLVPKKSVIDLYNICTNKNKKLIIYKEYTHLMLLSKNPDKVIANILSFIDEKEESNEEY